MKYTIKLFSITLFLKVTTSFANPSILTPADTINVKPHFGKLPLSFEENQGQTDKSVKFLSRGQGYTVFLTPTEAILSLSKPAQATAIGINAKLSAQKLETETIRMQLIDANLSPKISGESILPGKIHYLNNKNPNKWRTNIPTYGKVNYQKVYPGIDLVYYGNQRQLEYDFIVAPDADPKKIQLSFIGQTPSLNTTGDLAIGNVQFKKPIVYQTIETAIN